MYVQQKVFQCPFQTWSAEIVCTSTDDRIVNTFHHQPSKQKANSISLWSSTFIFCNFLLRSYTTKYILLSHHLLSSHTQRGHSLHRWIIPTKNSKQYTQNNQSVVNHNWYNQKSIFSTFLWEGDPNLWKPELVPRQEHAPFGGGARMWICAAHAWMLAAEQLTCHSVEESCTMWAFTDAKITCTSLPVNSSDWRFSTSSADSWFYH